MAVQLHYYGSVFDLSTTSDDEFWIEHIRKERERATQATGPLMLSVTLADGRDAWIPLTPTSPLVIVAHPDFMI